jgi:chromodomain-helicase-DNA-binding protein 4
MSPQQSTDLSAQQNVAPSRCPPVEAEHTGLLDMATQAVHDLQPEMQPSILLPDAPVQKMPDDRSQTGVQPDRATGLPSKILPSAPVPAKQNTSLLAQQSLATSNHSPAEAEPADILGTEPACDLQPSLGEVHDEPAEEQSCIMCAIAAQNLQPETQSSTSMQSAPFERTHPFVMHVLQSLTVHHTLEPSLDPHARAESTHTLGSLTGHVLQPEVQSLASMKDRLAEAEGAVMLGSTAAEDLQPRKNDLHTFMHCQSLLSKDHEHKVCFFILSVICFFFSFRKKSRQLFHLFLVCTCILQQKALLEIECNQEIAKVKKKYASLLQKEDSAYLQNQRDLTDIYGKVFGHNSLAEGFQGEITLSAAAQGIQLTAACISHCFLSNILVITSL